MDTTDAKAVVPTCDNTIFAKVTRLVIQPKTQPTTPISPQPVPVSTTYTEAPPKNIAPPQRAVKPPVPSPLPEANEEDSGEEEEIEIEVEEEETDDEDEPGQLEQDLFEATGVNEEKPRTLSMDILGYSSQDGPQGGDDGDVDLGDLNFDSAPVKTNKGIKSGPIRAGAGPKPKANKGNVMDFGF